MDIPFPAAARPVEVIACEAWSSLDWLVHGFSQRQGGCSMAYGESELNLGFTLEDSRETVLANRRRLVERLLGDDAGAAAALVTLRQVHSADVYRVGNDEEPGAEQSHALTGDGLMTDRPGKLLAILTADCVPVLVLDRRLRVVAGFHAGWRGTVQGIVQAGVARVQAEFHCRAEDLSAAIGPCISACCYTVGDEVRTAFGEHFSYADELFRQDEGGPLRLDLVEANRRQLLEAGLRAANVHVPGLCTSCHPDRFFSHRRSGGRTGRMMSVIGIRPGRNEATASS